jgi:type I restriction-modification system DNA methylase subunit
MDASQYKDYVLVLLFIKYISDKYVGVPHAPITIPARASFKEMVALCNAIYQHVYDSYYGPGKSVYSTQSC